ncbi:MAG TPA: RNA 2',3'-cyclic phosphodiesterase [Desulfotomaculum sp.]|nr:MAG: 2'-5' RNA ligase [Desulfotomaculum sp. BICA1-6]HBX22857.1 RNA 2',3'-cyclic phosphodiesterase [Desulfotomaculum sp.]
MDQARLFWAVNLPAEIKTKLASLRSLMRGVPVDVKWVEQQNLHLTVKFMGDVDRTKINDTVQAVKLAAAGSGPISLELHGTGFFPHSRQPRVIWVGVRGEVEKFRRLHQLVEKSLIAFGFPPDGKGFSPHLTVGRVRSPKGVGDLVQKILTVTQESACFGRVDVTTIELMESELTRRGPVYSVVDGVTLSGV